MVGLYAYESVSYQVYRGVLFSLFLFVPSPTLAPRKSRRLRARIAPDVSEMVGFAFSALERSVFVERKKFDEVLHFVRYPQYFVLVVFLEREKKVSIAIYRLGIQEHYQTNNPKASFSYCSILFSCTIENVSL